MSKSAEIQREREIADLARHIERIPWLESENPTWSDGGPVDGYTRQVLLEQSKDFVKSCRFSTPTSQP